MARRSNPQAKDALIMKVLPGIVGPLAGQNFLLAIRADHFFNGIRAVATKTY